MGLRLLPDKKSSRLIVIGDFDLIIKGLRQILKNPQSNIARTFIRIRDMEHKFREVYYLHVYRTQNDVADSFSEAKKRFTQGLPKHGNENVYDPIP